MVGRAVRCAPALAVALLAAAAFAEDPEPIHVAVHAPAGCPAEAAFADEVLARTNRARIVGSEEAARTFTVTITEAAHRVRGRLTIRAARGAPAIRDVEGASCDEVIAALGLVAALAIDPSASIARRAPPAPSPSPPLPKRPPRTTAGPGRLYDALPWWGPVGEPLPAILEPRAPSHWRAGWSLEVGGASDIGPGLVLTTSGLAAVERVDGAFVSPAFRFGAVRADSGFRAASQGHLARFALLAARVEGCPRLAVARWLAAYPCVRVDAGELSAWGFAHVSLGASRPWVAPGAGARLEAEIAGRLTLSAGAFAEVPLVRDTFAFGPPGAPQVVHAVPVAGGSFAAGLGTHFP